MTDAPAVAPGAALIDQYQKAGFSTDEINQYRDKVNGQYQAAGFGQDEINQYWGTKTPDMTGVQNVAANSPPKSGSLTPDNPEMRKELVGSYERGETKSPGEFAQTALRAVLPVIASGMKNAAHPVDMVEGMGDAYMDASKAWVGSMAYPFLSTEHQQRLIESGIVEPEDNQVTTPGQPTGPELALAALKGERTTVGKAMGGIYAPVSAILSPIINPAMQALPTAAEKAGASPGWAQTVPGFVSMGMDMLGLAGAAHVTNIEGGAAHPKGPWEAAPKAQDFVDAAANTTGTKGETEVSQVLRNIYAEQGVHPAQVTLDAQTQPTVAQDLAAGRTPRIYGNPEPVPEIEPTPTENATPRYAPATAAKSAAGSVYQMMSPKDLSLDPQRFQYKASEEGGVTGALAGVKKWEPALANPITVWEGKDGKTYVVNGHQRYDLATRAEGSGQENVQMPARVFKESDGYTPEYMRSLGARQNIAEGSGTAIDAAKVLREAPVPESRELPELPPKSQLVQQAHGLAALDKDSFGMVVNDIVPASYGAEVGHAIADPKEQLAAMDVLAKSPPSNLQQARLMVQDIKNSGFLRGDQTSLFGESQIAQSLFNERSRILDNGIRQLRQLKTAFGTAINQEGALTEAGNVMSKKSNETAKVSNEKHIATLQADATRRGPVSEALSAAARDLKSGKSVASVTKQFLDSTREIVARGGREELRPGHIAGSAKPAEPSGELDVAGKLGEQLAAANEGRLAPKAAQKAADDGLFDVAGRGQKDMFGGEGAGYPSDASLAKKAMDEFLGNEEGALRLPRPKPKYVPTSAEEKILDKISVGDSDQKPAPLSWDNFYKSAVDKLDPIRRITDAIQKGNKSDVLNDTYKLMRNLAGNYGRVQQFLEQGTYDFKTYKTTGKSLKAILEPVKDDINGLRAYAASRRAIELEDRGIKSGMPLADAKQVIIDGAKKYEPVFKELNTYQDAVLKYLKDSGVMTDEQITAMRGANRSYVPFYRVMDDETYGQPGGAAAKVKNPIMKIKGSDRDIIDPIESIVRNTYSYVSIAEKNAAVKSFFDGASKSAKPDEFFTKEKPTIKPTKISEDEMNAFLKKEGITDIPDNTLTVFRAMRTPLAKDEIGFFDKGKWTVLKIDPEIAEAFNGTPRSLHGFVFKMIAAPAKMLRYGLIEPAFIIRHLERNTLSATVIGSKGKIPFENLYKGIFSYLGKDEAYQDWLKSGGKVSALSGVTRDDVQDMVKRLTDEHPDANFLNKAYNIAKTPFDIIHAVQQSLENMQRLGAYKSAMTGLNVDKANIVDSGYYARNISPDPSRIGSHTGLWNSVTALANTEIQHTAQLIDALRTRPIPTLAKGFAFITLPTIINWAVNQENVRQWNIDHPDKIGADPYTQAQGWERDAFWITRIGGYDMRIPKPFFMGFLFATVPERILDAVAGNDSNGKGIKEMLKDMFEQATPNTIPTALTPILEQVTNHSMFRGTPLVPDHLMQQLPEYRYSEYTSELTKAVGRLIGKVPFVGATSSASPIVIDNYLRAWTGTMGTYVKEGIDASLRKTGVLPDPLLPANTLSDIPFVRAFTLRHPSAQAESIQRFQSDYRDMSMVTNTYKALVKQGQFDQARELVVNNPDAFEKMDKINKVINEQNQAVRSLYKNPSINPDQKRQLIDGIYYQMIQLARAGNNIVDALHQQRRAQGAK